MARDLSKRHYSLEANLGELDFEARCNAWHPTLAADIQDQIDGPGGVSVPDTEQTRDSPNVGRRQMLRDLHGFEFAVALDDIHGTRHLALSPKVLAVWADDDYPDSKSVRFAGSIPRSIPEAYRVQLTGGNPLGPHQVGLSACERRPEFDKCWGCRATKRRPFATHRGLRETSPADGRVLPD